MGLWGKASGVIKQRGRSLAVPKASTGGGYALAFAFAFLIKGLDFCLLYGVKSW